MHFIAEFKKTNEEKKRKIGTGILYTGLTLSAGQQTIRSGIPRLLGVRLESHSTSNKNAKEILKNDGWLDPTKSGTGAIRALEGNEQKTVGYKPSEAKGKVYITGVHQNALTRTQKNTFGVPILTDPKKENPLIQVLNRKDQRAGYRAQSTINWDEVNKDVPKIKELTETNKALLTKKIDSKDLIERLDIDKKIESNIDQVYDLQKNNSQRLKNARNIASIKGLLPWTGRSLYIGGSDEYFNKNFKPDFDDVRAMYSENKIKVHGNRASATLDALKKEGDGSKLKGAIKLIKANPKRALAGAAILGIGGTLTASNAKIAYNSFNPNPDIKVTGYAKKTKSGKWSNVKSFFRKKLKKKKNVN